MKIKKGNVMKSKNKAIGFVIMAAVSLCIASTSGFAATNCQSYNFYYKSTAGTNDYPSYMVMLGDGSQKANITPKEGSSTNFTGSVTKFTISIYDRRMLQLGACTFALPPLSKPTTLNASSTYTQPLKLKTPSNSFNCMSLKLKLENMNGTCKVGLPSSIQVSPKK
jgi:hypothetical protein